MCFETNVFLYEKTVNHNGKGRFSLLVEYKYNKFNPVTSWGVMRHE